jgi:lipocalin-like protein
MSAHMGRSGILTAGVALAWSMAFANSAIASEPSPDSVVGASVVGPWQLVSIYEEDDTGEESPMFGFNPEGRLVLDAAGHFSLQIVDDLQWNKECHRANAMGPRAKAGPAMLAYFGSYAIDPDGGSGGADNGGVNLGTMHLHVDHGLHLSWEKPDRSADVIVSGDRMEFVSSIASPTGASYSRLVWKRLR